MLARLAVLDPAQRTGGVRRVRAVDIRLQLGQVDLHDFVVVLLGVRDHGVVRSQLAAHRRRQCGDLPPARSHKILRDVHPVGEDGTRGADLGAHIADGGLAGAGEVLRAGAEIFKNGVGTALDGQHAGELEDDVLGRGPALERAGQAHADDARHPELPGHARHHIHRIGAAHADRQHAHAARIGCMGVRPDHHAAREGIVLQDDLMDDAGTRLPETDAVAGGGGSEEVIDLRIRLLRLRQIRFRALPGADEMIAVDRGRHAHGLAARAHELQQRHLRRRILHRYAVGTELAEVLQPLQRAEGRGVEHVGIQDLLRQRQRPAQQAPDGRYPLSIALIEGLDGLQIEHTDLLTNNTQLTNSSRLSRHPVGDREAPGDKDSQKID